MNRTIKDATVKRDFYETLNQLRTHLRDFVDAYNLPDGSRLCEASPHTSSSATNGPHSRRDQNQPAPANAGTKTKSIGRVDLSSAASLRSDWLAVGSPRSIVWHPFGP